MFFSYNTGTFSVFFPSLFRPLFSSSVIECKSFHLSHHSKGTGNGQVEDGRDCSMRDLATENTSDLVQCR